MLSLLIETSTEWGIIALIENNQILYKKELPLGFSHSKFLMSLIEESLVLTKRSISQLSFIATGIGPGSYTGIRVGVMIAKTLSFAREIPLIGICSLNGFVMREDKGIFLAMIDAKIGGVYIQKCERRNGEIIYLSDSRLSPLDQLKHDLDLSNTIVTPNKMRLEPLFKESYPALTFHWIEQGPSAEQLMKVALEQFAKGKTLKHHELEILYLRQTQAEIEREKKVGRR